MHSISSATHGLYLQLLDSDISTTINTIKLIVDKHTMKLSASDVQFYHWPSYISLALFVKAGREEGVDIDAVIDRLFSNDLEKRAMESGEDAQIVSERFWLKIEDVIIDIDRDLLVVCSKEEAQRIDKILQVCKDPKFVEGTMLYNEIKSREVGNSGISNMDVSNVFD